jgi:hypothetical protein
MKHHIAVIFALFSLISCGADRSSETDPIAAAIDLDSLAREYLFLELSMSGHDSAHVDAYFGPAEIQESANRAGLSLQEIGDRSALAAKQLQDAKTTTQDDPEVSARIDGLIDRLGALDTRIALNNGQSLSFDDESQRLFGATAPDHDAAHFRAILDDIDVLLGGEGDLSVRVNDFRNRFAIPSEQLAAVFDAAISECRRRTLLYIDLPERESFSIEYVNDKPWSGYNWYQGDAQSLIQINTDLPIFIDRAVDLGCHEGYPGHHTFNALLEKNLVQDRGWIEFSLYPLFSPQSLIAEGSGNYGIELAFPGDERVDYERDTLFPLAGLDPAEADRYYALQELLAKLNYAGNEAARDYLNGDIDRDQAVQWLVEYSLNSPERARQRTDFFDTYRSYVINYNLGKDMVHDYIERDTADQAARWKKFEQLLSSAKTSGDLH